MNYWMKWKVLFIILFIILAFTEFLSLSSEGFNINKLQNKLFLFLGAVGEERRIEENRKEYRCCHCNQCESRENETTYTFLLLYHGNGFLLSPLIA